MRPTRRSKTGDSLYAIALAGGRVQVAHVIRDAGRRPRVDTLLDAPSEGSSTETLRRLRKELRLDRAQVSALLAPGEYQVHAVDAPDVPEAEMRTAVRWRLKDVIDYPPEQATVDVLSLPQASSSHGRLPQVLAVSARSERISGVIELFDAARLDLAVIDIHETAQRNVASLYEEGERAVALVSFTATGGLFTVSARGQLYLSRALETGTELLSGTDADTRSGLIDRMALELQRSLDHFDRQYGGLQVARLLIAPFAEVDALRLALAENLYVPVEILDLARALELESSPLLRDPAAQGRHLRLLGAALRDF